MNISGRYMAAGLAVLLLSGAGACGDGKPDKTSPKADADAEKTEKPAPRKPVVEDSEEGSLKIRIPSGNTGKKEAAVRADTENVTVLESGETAEEENNGKLSAKEKAVLQSLRTPRPEGSLAARLSSLNSGKVIRWSPQWTDSGTGGVRLPATALSPDKSIILLVETLGDAGGPYGSRLVFLDTHSWTILAVHHLWKKDVRAAAITPSGIPVLISRAQEALKTPDEILLLDPWKGTVSLALTESGAETVTVDGQNRLFVAHRAESEQSGKIAVYTVQDDFSFKRQEITSSNTSPAVAFSADGQTVFLSGDKALESFKTSDLRPLETVALPEGFVTESLLVLPDETVIAAPEKRLQMRAAVIRGGHARFFGENSDGILIPLPGSEGKSFGAVMSRKGRIVRFSSSTLQETASVEPEASRPRTIGNPQAVYAFATGATAVLDERGNFYLLYRDSTGKRWRKDILFTSTRK